MSRLTHPQTDYHTSLLRSLSKTIGHYDFESSVLLCSGKESISVEAVLLRKASNFLRELIPTPSVCSCNQHIIVLPDTPSHTLDSFVQLIYGGLLPAVSDLIAKAVMQLANELGIKNITVDDPRDVRDLDLSVEFAKIDEHGDDDELDSDLDVDEHDNGDSSDSDSLNFDRELKIRTELDFNGRSILLRFPKSRLGRKKSKDLDDSSKFLDDEFKRRVRNEYNNHPVGQYMGPYDQPKDLSLSAQLPNSKLDFERYTQFYHNGTTCYNYKIGNYKKYKALEKIDSYQIDSEKECDENNCEEDDVYIYYTCQHKKCKIPCPCAHCCSEMVQRYI